MSEDIKYSSLKANIRHDLELLNDLHSAYGDAVDQMNDAELYANHKAYAYNVMQTCEDPNNPLTDEQKREFAINTFYEAPLNIDYRDSFISVNDIDSAEGKRILDQLGIDDPLPKNSLNLDAILHSIGVVF
ncbi:MAG: hypothetical protein ACD_62C00048G0004 [uncultured bacterium]|nr:MAG: hypothetical protein ACD_62C00048G0004 [uncultured bacterium]